MDIFRKNLKDLRHTAKGCEKLRKIAILQIITGFNEDLQSFA